MPRINHVKKARKDNEAAGIKKGQEYWWAGYRLGYSSSKRYWKSPPRPSQVAGSEYDQSTLAIQEEMEDADPSDADELATIRDEWADGIREIADECDEKLNNMPEGLQQGDVGQLLEERRDACNEWADVVESADCDWVEVEGNTEPADDEPVNENGHTFEDFARDALDEMVQAFQG